MDVGESVIFNYTGDIQSFVVPNSGYYKFDIYGAEGGRGGWYFSRNWTNGGKGGHSVGYKKLKKGQILYIGVGGRGNDISAGYGSGWLYTSTGGGYNGGGTGYAQDTGEYDSETQTHVWRGICAGAGSGGGATHVAIGNNRGTLSQYSSNLNEILIVAGGGGGGFNGSANWNENYDHPSSGGAGGNSASGAFGQGSSYGRQQDAYAREFSEISIGGGGGGGYNGGSASPRSGGGGGSNFLDNVDSIKINGVIENKLSETGKRSGHGIATITFVKKTSVYLGDKEAELYYGDKSIDSIYFGEHEV